VHRTLKLTLAVVVASLTVAIVFGAFARDGETIVANPSASVTTRVRHAGRPVELAFGGDVLLGAESNTYVAAHGAAAPLAAVPELHAADVAIVNLESVVAPGADVVETGDPGDHYFLARPEMLGVLVAAGIDLVSTGNNHARDYGAAALAAEDGLLTAMGLAHPGIGRDQAAACAPAYLVSEQLRIAVISVNTAEPAYEAGSEGIGTCHVAPDDLEGWRQSVGPAVA